MGILEEVLGQVKGEAPAATEEKPKAAATAEADEEDNETDPAPQPDGKKRIHTFSKSFEKKFGRRPQEKVADKEE